MFTGNFSVGYYLYYFETIVKVIFLRFTYKLKKIQKLLLVFYILLFSKQKNKKKNLKQWISKKKTL